MTEFLLLFLAGLGAGALNALAGGGTFLTLPALIWCGVPPVMANATATVSAIPGYLASAWAYRSDLSGFGARKLASILTLVCVGGALGSVLLTHTPGAVFLTVVPFLLLVATLLFALAPWILRRLGAREGEVRSKLLIALLLLLVAIYGGYFNGGLGIVVLAVLSILRFGDLHRMNGLKSMVASVVSLTSLTIFSSAGLVLWEIAAPVIIGNVLGGFSAAHLSRKLRDTRGLRIFVIGTGLTMSAVFLIKAI